VDSAERCLQPHPTTQPRQRRLFWTIFNILATRPRTAYYGFSAVLFSRQRTFAMHSSHCMFLLCFIVIFMDSYKSRFFFWLTVPASDLLFCCFLCFYWQINLISFNLISQNKKQQSKRSDRWMYAVFRSVHDTHLISSHFISTDLISSELKGSGG